MLISGIQACHMTKDKVPHNRESIITPAKIDSKMG